MKELLKGHAGDVQFRQYDLVGFKESGQQAYCSR